MAKNTQPRQELATVSVPAKSYQVTGLEAAETMPIRFEGREFDLANLTDDELAYLLQFPDQVPYLKLASVISPNQ